MLITIAKILLFPLVMIGYALKCYDILVDYVSKHLHFGKKAKEREKQEEWWYL